jgi:hypothetical protein
MCPSCACILRPIRALRTPKRGAGATLRRERCYPKRGAGKAGCPLHPRPRVQSVESTRVRHHRFTGTPGLPCAMVLTVSSALSLVTGLCCHHHRRDAKHHHQLDASVGASGPHGFAVRLKCRSLSAPSASIASRPASVTIASRPSVGRDGDKYAGDLGEK